MSVPKWRRSESRLDAFYEAVKLRHIVTQIIMRSYRLKTNFKSLIPDRLRKEVHRWCFLEIFNSKLLS